jgi:hypothetical protein
MNVKVLSAVALLAGVSVTPAMGQQAMSLQFTWAGTPACSGTSPAFRIARAPAGTAQLRFALQDRNAPNYNHGGGTAAFAASVPAGGISGFYRGPCPPAGQVHTYVWTVEALAADGRVLGTAQASGTFPPAQ